ncbi:aldehyde dehydrogenase (NAD+) [Mameliella alba]|uniref:aldehyde dehydrogenase family protein n=1 Tax=Mameliella alba TaxID=561184 RepID=UPI00088DE9DB|nr:aldehyde dehydrogenase family protein [Mameliella alba]OWV47196.1 aldehyde dehydrogenase [Mameliella alba]PTR38739.1 aldehyde dehydrogenase (NAD+) [Mameliella alba]GGF69017.1 aldehyde dehydrogenase [Mameliella alba]SDD40762.1 aldehyde dehydrogenase (NAD+) [Mameliella alba]
MNIKEIFESMDYGPAPESAGDALAWIVDQGSRFGHFINGAFTEAGEGFDSRNPATGEVLATLTQATQDDVDAAVAAARAAQPEWEALGGPGRARYLYALARLLQKHARLFAVLETLDNGKPIRESRDIDIPLAQRHFYYHAGMAQLMDSELPDRQALGVCGQIVPWNFPLLMLSWKIAPALATGNTVVLKPAEWTSLTALLFADICQQAGLPKGVVNIVTGDGRVGEMICDADVDKIAFTGSTEVGRKIRQATAGRGIGLTLELGGKSPYVVFEDADLDSAIEGLVDAIWFNQGQVCCAGSRLLVQEGVADAFHDRLRARMDKLRIGNPLDKCIDVGAIVDPEQLRRIEGMVSGAEGTVYRANCPLPEGCYYPPTLVSGLSPASPLMQEEIFGPVLVSSTFRTPAEAVALANNTRYGLAASVWSENINTALDVAPQLAAGVVWVNGTNMFDAAAGFGGVRESGFGREGGWEGLRAYTRARGEPGTLSPVEAYAGDSAEPQPVDRTAKLYVGGKQARPDGGYARSIYDAAGKLIGQAPIANRKDIRNAVEAARGAGGWAKATAHNRAQVLYYIGENLSARAGEFAALIDRLTGSDGGAAEVEASVNRLFTAAAWADKFDGGVRSVPMRGVALAMNEPCGVIGALCADEAPLLGLVSVMAPAIAMGNRVVLVASDPFPLAALEFTQVLETSDVPGGVVNILTGSHAELAPVLASHLDVEAVWSFSSSDLSEVIESASAGNLKRTWVNDGRARDWLNAGDARDFLEQATEVKTVWVPYGA